VNYCDRNIWSINKDVIDVFSLSSLIQVALYDDDMPVRERILFPCLELKIPVDLLESWSDVFRANISNGKGFLIHYDVPWSYLET
jgi:hypothetical protein